MTKSQIALIERSFHPCGDTLVFQVGSRVFVSDEILKHRKEATIEMMNCCEVDDTCFDSRGEYYGETLNQMYRIILHDPYPDSEAMVATVYYDDEVVQIRKEVM